MGKIIMNGIEYNTMTTHDFPPLIYSDEEREVGVWRDGKPLYQKTIKCIANGDTSHGISNIDKVIETTGGVIRDADGTFIKFPSYNTEDYYGYIVGKRDSVYIYISGTNWIPSSTQPCYITMLYTKTTDEPGSGKYYGFDITNWKVYIADGTIFNNSASARPITGNGHATVMVVGKIARIDFDVTIITASGGSNDWVWGLNRDLLVSRNPNIPLIKPINGGQFMAEGQNSDTRGYSSVFEGQGSYWRPGRYYTQDCTVIGGWPANQCRTGRWYGICYGEVI